MNQDESAVRPYGMTRREFMRLAAGGAGALALAACAPATGSPAPAAPAAVAASGAAPSWQLPEGKVTVTLWHGTDATLVSLYRDVLVPGYQALHPNYTIDDNAVIDVDSKLLVAISTGTAPDIFHTNAVNLTNYMARGAVAPIPPAAWGYSTQQELVDKAFIPGSTIGMSYQSQVYGAASQLNAQDFVMNNRLFAAAGLDPVKDAPKTWDDVARYNQLITKRDSTGRITQKGFDWTVYNPTNFSNPFQLLVYQGGGDVLDPDGRAAFNTDAGVQALQIMKKVAVDPRITSATQLSPIQDFADESTASRMAGVNNGVFVEATNPAMKGNYTFAPLPQINPTKPANLFTFFAIVVNSKSPDDVTRVAWDFHHWICTQPAVWLKATGQLQNQAGWADTDEAKQIMPYIGVGLQDIKIGRPSAITVHNTELQTGIHRAVERHLYQDVDPKQSLDQAAAEFNAAL